MIFSVLSLLSLLLVVITSVSVAASGVPYISEQFSVNNIQIDDTLDGEIVVRQLIIQDPIAKRSKMLADGKLVNGVLEQVIRCDGANSPSGYIVQLTGPSLENTQCLVENITETWSNFWSFPANATYLGKLPLPREKNSLFVAGSQQEQQEYDCYMYWTEYEQWKVFITQRRDESTGKMINVPIWSGRVFTPYPTHHRFHSHWVNFRAGAAPVSAYNVTGNTTNCKYAQSNTLRRAAHDVHH